MKIEDKDIDKLLEDFQGADIKVPDNLDEKLNEKLNSIKSNKKYKSVSKYLVSSAPFLSPLPINFDDTKAAASVTLTSSSAKFLSIIFISSVSVINEIIYYIC